MGKKERDIKRQNAEFYKEYNQDLDKEFQEYAKSVQVEDDKQHVLDEKERKEESFAMSMVESLNEHSQTHANELNVSFDNMFNYIRFFRTCVYREQPKKATVSIPVAVDEPIVESTYDASEDPEIQELVRCIITDSGEAQIVDDYLKEYHGGNVPEGQSREGILVTIRKYIIKTYGSDDYYNVVQISGKNNYNKAKHSLGL